MIKFIYLTRDDILALHKEVMQITKQNITSQYPDKDISQTTELVQNNEYYPDIFSKLAYYLFSILQNHYFIDGNKRVALATVDNFIKINGLNYDQQMFRNTIEYVILMAASSLEGKEFLCAYFEMILSGVRKESVLFEIYSFTESIKETDSSE